MEKKIIKNNSNLIDLINSILDSDDAHFNQKVAFLKNYIQSDLQNESNSGYSEYNNYLEHLRKIIDKIESSKTYERKRYYLRSARKSIIEIKTNGVNDINLNRWQDYNEIITDSLWIFPKRERGGGHLGWYWGNFIPQIPRQIMLRYSRQGDWVIDPFAGSGTTLIEAMRLKRNAVGIEINNEVVKRSIDYIAKNIDTLKFHSEIINGNSLNLDYKSIMERLGIKEFDLAIVHPPYHNIIKFSDNEEDLSNVPTTGEFLLKMERLSSILFSIMKKNGYAALVIGDKYEGGELFPLGFKTMEAFLKSGFRLKSIVVKNFDFTRSKRGQDNLWRYRALVGGYYVFKHEYIMVFEK